MQQVYLSAIAGGLLIGLAAVILLLSVGRIAGISGILWGAVASARSDLWRWTFLAGLLLGGVVAHRLLAVPTPDAVAASPLLAGSAGLLVGLGVKLGSGCTSGHGVCGLGLRTRRSITATLTFMTAGVVTLFVSRHILGYQLMQALAALIGGLVFGLGLAISGMTDRQRVLGFLDVTGDWQPALAFVMGSAVLVTALLFPLILARKRPLLTAAFSLPGKIRVDRRLVGGATLFGVGWGLYGLCPGPALIGLLYGQTNTIIFVGMMLVGMLLASRLPERPARD